MLRLMITWGKSETATACDNVIGRTRVCRAASDRASSPIVTAGSCPKQMERQLWALGSHAGDYQSMGESVKKEKKEVYSIGKSSSRYHMAFWDA